MIKLISVVACTLCICANVALGRADLSHPYIAAILILVCMKSKGKEE
jgi:hypothetical protein